MICTISNNQIAAFQAICLIVITLGSVVYTLNKNAIKVKRVSKTLICFIIGNLLGIVSSFLGIGGGPINIIILNYFFSMSSKVAAQNSLFIIFFSQTASLLKTALSKAIPSFQISLLAGMLCFAVLGSVFGRKINERISEKMVQKLFLVLNLVIIMINVYNIIKYI